MRLPVLLLVFGFEAHGHEQAKENGCADPGRTGLKAAGERAEHALFGNGIAPFGLPTDSAMPLASQ